MANDPREGLFEYEGFKGLRNNADPTGFDLGDLVSALNVDICDDLQIHRRKGQSAVLVAGIDRDLWATGPICLGVGSNVLKQLFPDYTTTSLRTGLTPARSLAYAPVGARVYYANGVESGVVENGASRTWGIVPPGRPTLAATGGTLLAGKYQCVCTYLRRDGQESGAGLATTIELTTTSGIALTAIPVSTDPGVVSVAVYATSVGGETLYHRGDVLNGQTTFTIREQQKDASPLLTQFLSPPPAGEFIGYFNGWMLVSKGNRLYISQEYAPELFDLRKSIPVLDQITMIAPVMDGGDGVWLGTQSQVIWLAGDDPSKWEYKASADYGVIPHTLAYGDGELIGDGGMSGTQAAFFATERGLCMGAPGGKFTNMTESRFAYPVQDRGAGIVRRHRGIAQYLCTLQGAEISGNVFA